MPDVRRLLQRNARVRLTELQAQPAVHNVIHHPQRGLGDTRRKLANLNAIELINVDHGEQFGECRKLAGWVQLTQYLDFKLPQLAVRDNEEVSAAARRVEKRQLT